MQNIILNITKCVRSYKVLVFRVVASRVLVLLHVVDDPQVHKQEL